MGRGNEPALAGWHARLEASSRDWPPFDLARAGHRRRRSTKHASLSSRRAVSCERLGVGQLGVVLELGGELRIDGIEPLVERGHTRARVLGALASARPAAILVAVNTQITRDALRSYYVD
jgi:hypothetical protein